MDEAYFEVDELSIFNFNNYIIPQREIILNLSSNEFKTLTEEQFEIYFRFDDYPETTEAGDIENYYKSKVYEMEQQDYSIFIQNCLTSSPSQLFSKIAQLYLKSLKSNEDKIKSGIYQFEYALSWFALDTPEKTPNKSLIREENPLLFDEMSAMAEHHKGDPFITETFIYNINNYNLQCTIKDEIAKRVLKFYLAERDEYRCIYDGEMEKYIDKLNIKLKYALEDIDKIKILKDEYYLITTNLQNSPFYLEYNKKFNTSTIFFKEDINNNFKSFITEEIKYSGKIIFDFLCNTNAREHFQVQTLDDFIDFAENTDNYSGEFETYHYDLFTEINDIILNINILGYIKLNINTYTSVKEKPKPKPIEYLDSKIFSSKETEEIFISTLIELNSIEFDHINNKYFAKPRKFQTVCDAIFTIFNRQSTYRGELFKKQLELQEYIIYLNENFDAKIKDTRKLSEGANKIRIIKPLILNKLKELA